MNDFNPGLDEVENVAAMKREGDLSRFLRDQIRAGRSRRETPQVALPPPPPPGHRPGAWPTGSSPPGPIRAEPPGAWAEALRRYPTDLNEQCECGGCRPVTNPKENR